MLLWSWSRVYNTPLEKVVDPKDIPAVKLLSSVCFDPPYAGRVQPKDEPVPAASYRLTSDLSAAEPWRSLFVSNTPGALPPEVPVFLAQGTDDTTIPPQLTELYMRRLCRAGDTVHRVTLQGVDHRFIARDAAGAAVAWIGNRFAGGPAPNDCLVADRP